MRVTENTNFNALKKSIHTTKSRLENLQGQAATLKKLNTPSDNPIGAAKVLEVRTDKINNEQFVTNAKLAETMLNNTDHALEHLTETLNRAKEIALSQSSGASANESTRLGVAQEVQQLYEHAIAVANTRIGDRYLFGGYKTHQPPVDPNGQYKGDEGQMMVEVGRGVFVTSNLPGIEVFNTAPKNSGDLQRLVSPQQPESNEEGVITRGPASDDGNEPNYKQNVNLFSELQSLRIALLSGDTEAIRSTLDSLDDLHGAVVSQRAKVGSRISGLAGLTQSLERHNITNAQLTQELEDADMTQVMSDMAKEETVFRSALATSQKLVQPTLLDFLK